MIKPKIAKPKKCRVCTIAFTPTRMGQKVCGPMCALTFARSVRAKDEKREAIKEGRETKAKLEKLKSKSQWAREAQAAVNAFIRLRDAALPCISCGRFHEGSYDAGHYLSRGARPELRFDELNIHKQCVPCNQHLSGNIVLYRINLLEKIGAEGVAYLEGPHGPKKYTVDDLKAIKATYSAKAKELKAAQAGVSKVINTAWASTVTFWRWSLARELSR